MQHMAIGSVRMVKGMIIMIDKEKVLKGLEYCRKYGTLCGRDCNGYYEYTDNLQDIIKANNRRPNCPYGNVKTGCVVTLIDDTIALLKVNLE